MCLLACLLLTPGGGGDAAGAGPPRFACACCLSPPAEHQGDPGAGRPQEVRDAEIKTGHRGRAARQNQAHARRQPPARRLPQHSTGRASSAPQLRLCTVLGYNRVFVARRGACLEIEIAVINVQHGIQTTAIKRNGPVGLGTPLDEIKGVKGVAAGEQTPCKCRENSRGARAQSNIVERGETAKRAYKRGTINGGRRRYRTGPWCRGQSGCKTDMKEGGGREMQIGTAIPAQQKKQQKGAVVAGGESWGVPPQVQTKGAKKGEQGRRWHGKACSAGNEICSRLLLQEAAGLPPPSSRSCLLSFCWDFNREPPTTPEALASVLQPRAGGSRLQAGGRGCAWGGRQGRRRAGAGCQRLLAPQPHGLTSCSRRPPGRRCAAPWSPPSCRPCRCPPCRCRCQAQARPRRLPTRRGRPPCRWTGPPCRWPGQPCRWRGRPCRWPGARGRWGRCRVSSAAPAGGGFQGGGQGRRAGEQVRGRGREESVCVQVRRKAQRRQCEEAAETGGSPAAPPAAPATRRWCCSTWPGSRGSRPA